MESRGSSDSLFGKYRNLLSALDSKGYRHHLRGGQVVPKDTYFKFFRSVSDEDGVFVEDVFSSRDEARLFYNLEASREATVESSGLGVEEIDEYLESLEDKGLVDRDGERVVYTEKARPYFGLLKHLENYLEKGEIDFNDYKRPSSTQESVGEGTPGDEEMISEGRDNLQAIAEDIFGEEN